MSDSSRIVEEKRQLRRDLRARRRALAAAGGPDDTAAVTRHAREIAALRSARVVAGYMAHDGEIDVGGILADALASGAAVLLPRSAPGGALELAPFTPGGSSAAPGEPGRTPLVPVSGRAPASLAPTGPGGLLEPTPPAVALDSLPAEGVLLAPAVALDRSGNRLGRGGGHYDRLIARLRAQGWYVVGVCRAEACLAELPAAPHDMPVDAILSEAGVLYPSPRR